jgi:hypothetical protein
MFDTIKTRWLAIHINFDKQSKKDITMGLVNHDIYREGRGHYMKALIYRGMTSAFFRLQTEKLPWCHTRND